MLTGAKSPNTLAALEGLYGYQQRDAGTLAENPVYFLLLEMGLGKSVVAIRAADLRGIKRILVLCPAVAHTHWTREIKRWQTVERSVGVIGKEGVPDTDVVVASYHALNNERAWRALRVRGFEVLVLDEAQYLKSPQAKRTQRVYGHRKMGEGLLGVCGCTWLLSGTLTPNGVHEMYTHLQALLPHLLRAEEDSGRTVRESAWTYDEFVHRYCITRETMYGRQIVGQRREVGELRRRLRPYVTRRLKRDVLKDLPPLRYELVPVDSVQAQDQLRRAERELGPDAMRYALSRVEHEVAAPAVATLRALLGIHKVPAVVDLVKSDLEAGMDKVVIFAWHVAVITALKEALSEYGAVVVMGSTVERDRVEAIDLFQTDGSVRVFIGQIQACGTAVTLTAASNVVFAEASWSPADNSQAAARCHRIGQEDPVLARFVTVPGSLDEQIVKVLVRKTRGLRELWQGM